MDLFAVIKIVRKRWLSISAITTFTVLATIIFSLAQPKVYSSQAELFVATQSSGSSADLNQGNTFTQQRVKSYVPLAKSPLVLQPAIDSLALDISSQAFATNVKASSPLNTVLIYVSVEASSPELAAERTSAVANSLRRTIEVIESTPGEQVTPVKATLVAPATIQPKAVRPNIARNAAIALLLGLALGFGLALLRDTLDTRIRSDDDVRAVSDASVLGAFSFDSQATERHLVLHDNQQSPRAEAFRQLRTNLQFVDIGNRNRIHILTSSIPSEGKTTITVNLAIAMAQTGMRVCLVDGDLRRPRVASVLGLDGSVGLTDALINRAPLEDVIQLWGQFSLSVIAAGTPPPNPSELLGSDQMEKTVGELSQHFDVVLVDSPPLLPVTDAAVLAAMAGGAVVIVGTRKVTREQFKRSLELLDSVDARLHGLVLNFLPEKGPDAYHKYGYGKYDHPYSDVLQQPVKHSLLKVGRDNS